MSTVTVPENKLAELQIKALQRDELLKQLENYEIAFEGHEDLLEQLYWEFDADRKKHPEDERIKFKNKLRFFAGLVNQYANQLKAAYADKSKALEKQRNELLEVLENWINALDEPSAWMECRDNAKKAIAKAKEE